MARKTAQIVRVRSGRVIDEITQLFLGRCPEARDGTYLWEVFDTAGTQVRSFLHPIAADPNAKVITVPDEGFLLPVEDDDARTQQ